MIWFKNIRWKNLLSTGNVWTEINLAESKSTLIVGENGAGKSTMLDAISFVLYGKAFRKINKNQLINSVNQKNLVVEISFNVGPTEYFIRRGIKPSVFEIFKNGELIEQDAAARDYQTYLEQNILKMNLKSFGQIVVLGSSTFVPFMQLSAAHRRDVIEDLLDIQVFSTMQQLLKDKVSRNKESVLESKYQMDLLEQKLESAKAHNEEIQRLKEFELSKVRTRVKEQLDFIAQEEEAVATIEKIVEVCVNDISDREAVREKHEKVVSAIKDLQRMISTHQKEVDFYSHHDNCPTCKQDIDADFKEETVSSQTKKLADITETLSSLEEKQSALTERLESIKVVEEQIYQANLKASERRANIKMAKNTLMQIKKDLADAEKSVETIDQSVIENTSKEIEISLDKYQNLVQDREMLKVANFVLKDGGIKSRIVRQYIPIINKLINKYLSALEFYVDFNIDETFSETIKSRFRDEFSYESFSEGEKMRIDLSILFAWRAVSRLRNSVSTNLLIMDEVFDSSLDYSGTEEFMRIINDLSEDSNIFVISHKGDALQDKFDKTLSFKKVKGFSEIAA